MPRAVRRLVRRSAATLPASVVRAVVGRVSVGAPAVGLPDVRHIVVLAPHPDDESLGCGGLLALASRRGIPATVVFATDGGDLLAADSPGDVAGRRRAQGAEACAILGARASFLGFHDGLLSKSIDELAAALSRTIEDTKPELITLPWFGDPHPDHRSMNRALSKSAIAHDVLVWGYEIFTPLPLNRAVDITDVIEEKMRAIAVHTADVFLDPDAMLALNRYRAHAARLGAKYAEAYFEAPAAEYVDWVASLDA